MKTKSETIQEAIAILAQIEAAFRMANFKRINHLYDNDYQVTVGRLEREHQLRLSEAGQPENDFVNKIRMIKEEHINFPLESLHENILALIAYLENHLDDRP